jgi:uncharacterized protein YbjT (DUF2867 family)
VNGNKILVAGATGRVGGAAVRRLLEAGYDVRALVRSAGKAERLRSLGAEPVVGDVTKPDTLAPAVEGCSGVFSALAAGPGRGDAETVEYAGNVNLLRPWEFIEVLLLALRGPLAFVPGRQRRTVSWISVGDVALAAVRAFERDITGLHELAGPDSCTFDEAYSRLARAWGTRITVLHPPLFTMRLPGLLLPHVGDLARMFAFFDAALYVIDPAPLRDLFGVEALTIEGWARRVSRPGLFR